MGSEMCIRDSVVVGAMVDAMVDEMVGAIVDEMFDGVVDAVVKEPLQARNVLSYISSMVQRVLPLSHTGTV